MKALRVAVVGVGHMGSLHARKLAALRDAGEGVELAGAVDVEAAPREEVARAVGTRAFADHRELAGEVDAAVVAIPTVAHHAVVRDLLKAGVDVLVEKPLAATLGEAEELLDQARSGGRVLQVGHLERFNAAMRTVAGYVRRPRFVEAHRLGPFPGRGTDVDVVRDLMIHDLDILQDLLGEEPDRIEAVGIPVLSEQIDIANARLTFPGGCVANLTASRVSPTPMRKLRFFQADGYFSVDFLAQSVVILRRIPDEKGGAPRIEMEKLELDPEDALLAQLRAFLRAVRDRSQPVVPAAEALSALRSALRIVDAMPPLDEIR